MTLLLVVSRLHLCQELSNFVKGLSNESLGSVAKGKEQPDSSPILKRIPSKCRKGDEGSFGRIGIKIAKEPEMKTIPSHL